MVSVLSILFMSVSLILSVALPIVLALLLHRRIQFASRSIIVGVSIFLIFQILTRIPLLSYLSKSAWYVEFFLNYYLLFGFLLALSAGLFEEIGRYIGFKFLLKNHLTWGNGVGYGIGHGGLESIFVGTTFLNELVISLTINSQHKLPSIPHTIIKTLVETPPYQFLVGGIERLFAFAIQIGLSLLVLYAVKNKKFLFLVLAILLHTIIDFVGVVLVKTLWLAEIFVGLFAIASLIWILKSKSYFKANSTQMESLIEI
ncbi:YhfC family intramembrane metalloprotease [Caldisericum sp. AR60]|uniref:YhfC family intramembrane metalloprotease n=1 Tax=Caldisericum sp. AR60 TaxID=3397852 RepID=UPI0039FD3DB9